MKKILILAMKYIYNKLNGDNLDPIKEIILENMAMRQQLSSLKHKYNPKPKLKNFDRFFWIIYCKFVNKWQDYLVIVKPDTVLKWHRRGFKLFWKIKSKTKPGRPRIPIKIIKLIKQMYNENNWGAPRIHGELLKLGFDICEKTISRYLPKKSTTPLSKQNWKTFIRNHLHNTVSMDFFVVPTITFDLLYCFIILDHKKREIIHFNSTFSPSSIWVQNQIKEAFPWDEHNKKYFIRDNDSIFDQKVKDLIKSMNFIDSPTAIKSPWQNPYCERVIGSIKRELLNNAIVINEKHLTNMLQEYFDYYHHDRTHLSLQKNTPKGRKVVSPSNEDARIISFPRVGSLHHRYEFEKAAA